MTPARFRWGMLLILLGTLFLLRNLNVLNDNFWGDLIIWFPVFLIAIGVEKIFTKTRLSFIAYLTSVFLFVGGLAIAYSGSVGGQSGDYFSEFSYLKEADPDVQLIKSRLDVEETDLTIRDSGDDLVYAKFNKFTQKPDIEFEETGDEVIVNFDSKSGSFLGGLVKVELDETQDWYVAYSQDVPLELECIGRNADIHLNFSTTPLRRLKLEADDATVYLKLGDIEPMVTVDLSGVDTKVRLRVPGNAGLKVIGDDYRDYLGRIGLTRQDDAFTSPDYEAFRTKIAINLRGNFSSLNIDYF